MQAPEPHRPAATDTWPEAHDADTARRLIAAVQASLQSHGQEHFRPPPPEPTTCCGRGCNGCVWEGFFAALQWWKEDAQACLHAS